ncbi:hypothetical protein ACCO44_08145 [Microbacterium maritypicum]|uniref:hypothetical protein n=1 Tax=Microbacterium maritypicum TaxID=33918 RepID=UPI003558C7D3
MLRDYGDRIQSLEAPSGETVNATVSRLTKVVADLSVLVNNIEATLTAFIENDVNDIVDARIAIALASYFSGSIAIGGNLLVNGTVQLPGARLTDLSIAEDRTVAWLAGAGDDRLGHT